MTIPCPPVVIDAELAIKIDRYATAKAAAQTATKRGTLVDKAGHYDQDTPLEPHSPLEADAGREERMAAIALADHLLNWLVQHTSA